MDAFLISIVSHLVFSSVFTNHIVPRYIVGDSGPIYFVTKNQIGTVLSYWPLACRFYFAGNTILNKP